MAKQIRYGAYADFKPEKMVTAELACVVSGDPEVSDGRSVYVCFTPGVVKRLTTYADFERELAAESEEIRSQFTQDIKDAIQDALDAKNAAETFVEQKGQEIDGLITETQKTTSDFVQQAQSDVNTAVTSANASKQAADEATQKALDAADKANAAAGGEIGEKTVTFESNDNLTPASFTTMPLVESGGKLKDYIRNFTTAVKNIRYLFKVLGSSDISKIGDGTVTNALATLMADKLNRTDIVNDLLSTAADKALSAAMGKQLQDAVNTLNTKSLSNIKLLYDENDYTTDREIVYTGCHLTLPSNSYCIIKGTLVWTNSKPFKAFISLSTDIIDTIELGTSDEENIGSVSVTTFLYISDSINIYLFGKNVVNNKNGRGILYCIAIPIFN